MINIKILDKSKFLNENYPFKPIPKLTDKRYCLHCEKTITVGDFEVYSDGDMKYICCPDAPNCDGTVIDWINTDEKR